MRLVTRGDLDGLAAAVLITTMERVDSVELIHPQEITDNTFPVRNGDILTNLPYHPDCSLWFDHHELTDSNRKPPANVRGSHALLPSVARVVYEYYRSGALKRFEPLVAETDRFDSAQLNVEDISNPRGAILLGFAIDPRTGLGIDPALFMDLVVKLQTEGLEAALAVPEIVRRAELCRQNDIAALQTLHDHSRMDGNVVLTDLRSAGALPLGNRFLIYIAFPDCNVSVRAQWGPSREHVAVSIGHSILNRTCRTDIGRLCSDFGGGGHFGAGACTLPSASADHTLQEIVRRLKVQ